MSTNWEQLVSDARLVSLPDIYLRLKWVLDEPEFTMSDVADVLDKDPGMTTRLLRLVNSSYFGLAAKIETVSRAVSMLGTQQVHDLVLATSVAETFNGMSSDVMDMHRFWQRSVFCGVAGRLLAYECNVLDSERLFVAGLLHDIGHLIMYQSLPRQCQQIIEKSENSGQPVFRLEQSALGFDYSKVGAALMQQWDLPLSLQEATAYHLYPAKADQYPLEVCIVHIAAALTRATDAGNRDYDWESQVATLAWQTTNLSTDQCSSVLEKAALQVDNILNLFIPSGRTATA